MAKFIFTKNKDTDLDTLNFFLEPKNYFYNDLSKDVFKDHPRLKDNNLSRQKYIEDYYREHQEKIDEYLNKINISWQDKWDAVEKNLSVVLRTSWNGIDEISCNIGISRIYPRDIKKHSLSICYLDPIEDSEAVILHEVTHFLYFKKWLELFPNDNYESLEAPHKFWHLSEIVAPIIDDDAGFKKFVPKAVIQSYPQYDDVFNEFKKSYLESETIEDYLKSAREKILKIKI